VTSPQDDRRYCNDRELIERMRVGLNAGRKALQEMRKDPRCPPRSIGGKTYLPAFLMFLDRWNGVSVDAPGNPAGMQEGNHGTTSHKGRARPSLAAAEELVGRGVAR
jgi:hypothetical protein